MKYIDLDFFQPERDRVAEKRKKMIPILITSIILIILVLAWIILRLDETRLTNKLDDLTNEVTISQNTVQTLEQKVNYTNSSISSYENGKTNINPLGMQISEIKASHLRSIMSSTPNEAFYKDITIKNSILTLDGYTKNTQVVAKIMNNLESTNLYDDIVISKIVKDDDSGYTFTINATMKE